MPNDVAQWIESTQGPFDTILYGDGGWFVIATRNPNVKAILGLLEGSENEVGNGLEHNSKMFPDQRPDRTDLTYFRFHGDRRWFVKYGLDLCEVKMCQ